MHLFILRMAATINDRSKTRNNSQIDKFKQVSINFRHLVLVTLFDFKCKLVKIVPAQAVYQTQIPLKY